MSNSSDQMNSFPARQPIKTYSHFKKTNHRATNLVNFSHTKTEGKSEGLGAVLNKGLIHWFGADKTQPMGSSRDTGKQEIFSEEKIDKSAD